MLAAEDVLGDAQVDVGVRRHAQRLLDAVAVVVGVIELLAEHRGADNWSRGAPSSECFQRRRALEWCTGRPGRRRLSLEVAGVGEGVADLGVDHVGEHERERGLDALAAGGADVDVLEGVIRAEHQGGRVEGDRGP